MISPPVEVTLFEELVKSPAVVLIISGLLAVTAPPKVIAVACKVTSPVPVAVSAFRVEKLLAFKLNVLAPVLIVPPIVKPEDKAKVVLDAVVILAVDAMVR